MSFDDSYRDDLTNTRRQVAELERLTLTPNNTMQPTMYTKGESHVRGNT
jgi:hypothetical protein